MSLPILNKSIKYSKVPIVTDMSNNVTCHFPPTVIQDLRGKTRGARSASASSVSIQFVLGLKFTPSHS